MTRSGLLPSLALALAVGGALPACDDSGEQETAPAPAPAPEATGGAGTATVDVAAGAASYTTFCTSCHGMGGDGNTPFAETLDPPPTKHNDGNYMNTLTDDHLFEVIREGGRAVGKSPNMAPWGGALSDPQIRNVVAYIRTLAEPPYTPPTQ